MFASILKWFGKANKKPAVQPASDMDEKLRLSLENFKNRPIYKDLTVDIIDAVPDHELLQTIFDNLSQKLSANGLSEYEAVLGLSKPQQAIYVIWCLEAEINNGGFNQYYTNPSGEFAGLTPDALALVGAVEFSKLVAKANHTYETENETILKYQDGTLEGFSKSYQDNPLNNHDDLFYELYKTEKLEELQIAFIRKNKVDFI